ncbi:hypothetical protein Hanom_Chr02g00156141 [Helianthus anomalus]
MVKDTVMKSITEAKFTTVISSNSGGGDAGGDMECVKCECCGLTEECTSSYIAAVRENKSGQWIYGLCVVAVKGEMERLCSESEEEASDRHMVVVKTVVVVVVVVDMWTVCGGGGGNICWW